MVDRKKLYTASTYVNHVNKERGEKEHKGRKRREHSNETPNTRIQRLSYSIWKTVTLEFKDSNTRRREKN